MKIKLDLDQLLRDERISPEEAEQLKELASVPPRRSGARDLISVLVWAAVGMLLGGSFGATVLSWARPARFVNDPELVHGSLTGLFLGIVAGLSLWALYPYQGEQ